MTSSQGIDPWYRRSHRFVGLGAFQEKASSHHRIFNESFDEFADEDSPKEAKLPYLIKPFTYADLIKRMSDNNEIRSYTTHCFVPTRSPLGGNLLNTYSPPRWCKVEPIDFTAEKGEATMHNLILKLCGGRKDEARHVIINIADMCQHPELLRRNAHVFISEQGAGKGMLGWFISRCIGESNHSIVDDASRYFSSSFNAYGCDSILRTFEEMKKDSQRAHCDPMKHEITRETTQVRQKYMETVEHANCSRIYMYSNHIGSTYLENKERRKTVHLALKGAYVNNPAFFNPIVKKIKDDAWIAGVYSFLMQYKYTDQEASTPFKNCVRNTVMLRSQAKTVSFLKFVVMKFEDLNKQSVELRSGEGQFGLDRDLYVPCLLKEFEDSTGILKTSMKAIYAKCEEYGFKTKRSRVGQSEDGFVGTYRDIDSIQALRDAIGSEIGDPTWTR
jgi:hypothetical protein